MIFFGTRSKLIKEKQIANLKCSNCEEFATMNYDVFAKYFHLYWIPFFGYKKETIVECDSCYKTYKYKELPENIKIRINREREIDKPKFPVWMFSGIIIVLILIPLAIFQSNRADIKKDDFIKNPKKGDVYFLNNTSSNYSTLRIDKVDNENVYFTRNDTIVTKYTKIFSILPERYYSNKKGIYSRKKIIELYKKDSIFSINRE